MLFNCIAASPEWGWGERRVLNCIGLAQLLLNDVLTDAWCLQRIFFGLWSMGCWTLRTANGHFSLLSLKWSMSSLKGSLSKQPLKFKCKRQCVSYFDGRPKLIPLMAKMLCERKQLVLQVQTSASIISLLEAWWDDSFNVVHASFKWRGAPGTGTWCPVCAEVSWWVCVALFL